MKTPLILTIVILTHQLAHSQTDTTAIRLNSKYFHMDLASLGLAPAHFNWGFQGSNGKPGIELRKTPYGYRHSYKGLIARSYFYTDNFFLEQTLGRAWGGEIEGVINKRISFTTSSGARNAFSNPAMWRLQPFRDIGIKIKILNR